LPQILNVLRVEMSLVGPLPCLLYECRHYGPSQCRRVATIRGLPGFWQVNGKNRTTFEEMIDLDLYYVEHRSLWLDLKIIARTVPAIIAQAWDQHRRQKPGPRVPVIPPSGMSRPVDGQLEERPVNDV